MIFRLTDKYDLVNSVCPILEDSVIQYVSKALVSIEVYISISINKPNFNYYAKGNGFIANREKGLIITNKHIVNTENIQKIWVKFCTSDVVKAKIIYSDPEHDFTIISASIPDNVSELELESFVKSNIINSSLVYSLNNENIFYTGKIISYESKGIYFSQSIVIDFDTKPGDSGAPLLNSANKVIGILFASSSMNAVALISDYIIDALTYLTNARLPERKSAGILFDYCKFEDMIKIDQVKKGVLCNHEYVICVRKKISVPEIENKFQLLDVVDLVNGKKISDIYLLQKIINEIEDIQINIWRNGKVFSIMPERFNLFSYQIKSYFYIDEAVIYPPGIFTHLITGAPLDKLFILSLNKTSALFTIHNSSLINIGGYCINTIQDLRDHAEEFLGKKDFLVLSAPHMPKYSYNNNIITNQNIEANIVHIENFIAAIIFELSRNFDEDSGHYVYTWKEYKLEEQVGLPVSIEENVEMAVHTMEVRD